MRNRFGADVNLPNTLQSATGASPLAMASGSLEGAAWPGDPAALIDVRVEVADVDVAEASESDRGWPPE